MRRVRMALVAVLLVAAGAGSAVAVESAAGAGISPAGYAQTAQRALQRAGGPFGYRVRCTGRYSNPAVAQVRVSCVMNEPSP